MVRGIATFIIYHIARLDLVAQSTGDGLLLTCSHCDHLHRYRYGMKGQYSDEGDWMYSPSTSATNSELDLAQ